MAPGLGFGLDEGFGFVLGFGVTGRAVTGRSSTSAAGVEAGVLGAASLPADGADGAGGGEVPAVVGFCALDEPRSAFVRAGAFGLGFGVAGTTGAATSGSGAGRSWISGTGVRLGALRSTAAAVPSTPRTRKATIANLMGFVSCTPLETIPMNGR
jgi:hypothetical protein